MQTIELKTDGNSNPEGADLQAETLSYRRLEGLGDGSQRSVLAIGKRAAIFVSFSDLESPKKNLIVPHGSENKLIVDVCTWDNKAAILFDKNSIEVFDLDTQSRIFTS